MTVNSRRTAAFIFARWLATKDFPSAMLPDGAERAFVQDLVYTTIRRLRPLRKILGGFLKTWPKGELEALLYIGAAQLLYMKEVPDFAAVNETVAAAKMSPNKNLAKVVNGVLRNLIRTRDASVAAQNEAAAETFCAEPLAARKAAAAASQPPRQLSPVARPPSAADRLLGASPLEERESYPTALVKRWIDRFGYENAEKLCKWHNEPAETWIARKPCCSTLAVTPRQGASPCRNRSPELSPCRNQSPAPSCSATSQFLRLERGERVESVKGYAEGEFIVQDPATALAVELMAVSPGESVLDACAAPGGKTIQLAWRGAKVTACEVNPKRRRRLEENLARVGLADTVTVIGVLPAEEFRKANPVYGLPTASPSFVLPQSAIQPTPPDLPPDNALDLPPDNAPDLPRNNAPDLPPSPFNNSSSSSDLQSSSFDNQSSTLNPQLSTLNSQPSTLFSKILVDAPCSNTGVFRRRPDARWNWSEEKLKDLVKLQASILDAVAPLVAPGGSIVYSTCSNEPEENLEQIRAFTRRHKNFRIVTSRESLPFETGHDGAFAAKVVRDEAGHDGAFAVRN